MKRKMLSISLLLAALLMGCTEELPYKKKVKFDVTSKDLIDTKSTYLYVPVVVDTLRTSTATRPHWVGLEKKVKFQFTENSLDLVQIEADDRFNDNPTNKKPVLSIPVTHVDYRCTEDDYGDCQNKEEENDDKHWSKRKYFVPDLTGLTIDEVNFLPISLQNLFGGCYSNGATEPKSFKLNDKGLVIEIEQNLKTQGQCAGFLNDLEDLSNLSFKVQYTYNILKLDSISSPTCDPKVPVSKQPSNCYSVVEYPRERDENVFGFFNTESRVLDVDNHDNQDGVSFKLNRFNPKRKVIPYYLSNGFFKPENAAIKEATYEGFNRINNALRESDSGLQLEIVEEKGLNPGDITKNMIIMVEDPVAAGLLGYGPSIANPDTGEILHARTVMYLGT
ncbi:MAG: hypothetical protein KDD25_07170, partial [Bdellovibrionales bacterium]|nr:hypothetical protein [Bdellovibrionales bacterium]